ncbi:hypothetical protein EMCRGX_G017515 [Ephydatia muelleri]
MQSSFIQTPINTSICLGSTAQFSCAATDVLNVAFLVNSQSVYSVGSSTFTTSGQIFIGNTRFRTLTVVGATNSYLITCTLLVSQGNTLNSSAYLSVQGPPSAPTDLNVTTYNDTATLLVWGLPPDAQSPSLLSYAVVIRNGSGVPVYSETVREPQLVITTPDPCGHYEATVTPMCGSIAGIQTSPVTLRVLSFSHVKIHSLSNEDQPNIFVSLPPNKHFNLTITAYNGYGNTSTTVVMSTFDVVGVSVYTSSPMELVCLFNTGSLARGCLVYLTDTDTGVTYCRVVWRSLDTPVNMSLCPSSNGPLSTGVYSVEVYDIESVSSVPALAGEVVTVFGPSTVYGPSVEDGHQVASCGLFTHCGPSVMQGQSGRSSLYYVGVGIGAGGGGGAVMVTASVIILVLCLIRLTKQKISAQKSDPLTTPNAVYGITVKCSDDTKMTDNPVYGAREDTY